MINNVKKESETALFFFAKMKRRNALYVQKIENIKETQRRVHGRTLCFFMLGSSMSGAITASAASTPMENPAFPSADTVIAKAATLLGTPYTYGNKGYWYAYDQGQYTPLSVETINNLGIDCSGLVYYTLTQLGYKTSGFSWNNPVPVDTDHWLTVNDNCTITVGARYRLTRVGKEKHRGSFV